MIFDSALAESLYTSYIQRGDKQAIDIIQLQTNPLIEVIAKSVCPELYDDLVQEGHLKLRSILLSGIYSPSKGSMYTFLSSVLRNHMADVVRKEGIRAHAGLEDIYAAPVGGEIMDCECVLEYGEQRFPSIHGSVARDAVRYTMHVASEQPVDGYRGSLRTLQTVYGLSRQWARTLHYGVLAVLRMHCMGLDWQANRADALELAGCAALEGTLLPEMVLLVGRQELGTLVTVLGGAYVKF